MSCQCVFHTGVNSPLDFHFQMHLQLRVTYTHALCWCAVKHTKTDKQANTSYLSAIVLFPLGAFSVTVVDCLLLTSG